MASVKAEWNCIKTFPDLSGTGTAFFMFVLYLVTPVGKATCVNESLDMINTMKSLLFAGKATHVKFGPDAKYIAVGSMDRNLRVFGLPGNDASLES